MSFGKKKKVNDKHDRGKRGTVLCVWLCKKQRNKPRGPLFIPFCYLPDISPHRFKSFLSVCQRMGGGGGMWWIKPVLLRGSQFKIVLRDFTWTENGKTKDKNETMRERVIGRVLILFTFPIPPFRFSNALIFGHFFTPQDIGLIFIACNSYAISSIVSSWLCRFSSFSPQSTKTNIYKF